MQCLQQLSSAPRSATAGCSVKVQEGIPFPRLAHKLLLWCCSRSPSLSTSWQDSITEHCGSAASTASQPSCSFAPSCTPSLMATNGSAVRSQQRLGTDPAACTALHWWSSVAGWCCLRPGPQNGRPVLAHSTGSAPIMVLLVVNMQRAHKLARNKPLQLHRRSVARTHTQLVRLWLLKKPPSAGAPAHGIAGTRTEAVHCLAAKLSHTRPRAEEVHAWMPLPGHPVPLPGTSQPSTGRRLPSLGTPSPIPCSQRLCLLPASCWYDLGNMWR
jgi:hypothetical protein